MVKQITSLTICSLLLLLLIAPGDMFHIKPLDFNPCWETCVTTDWDFCPVGCHCQAVNPGGNQGICYPITNTIGDNLLVQDNQKSTSSLSIP
ncbi:hypothetical protein LIER_02455 [Lithospermum erythrorhizon]|uniref:Secreted protein n=1 Tax=Lithospermum erythrorhizon TaxID=34254 RepID=A0AAV3NTA6_LITER